MIRREFFTVVGAALATAKVAGASPECSATLDIPVLVVSLDHCVLCGFDQMLKPWGPTDHLVMRCADRKGCQDRQLNALLGQRTIWQKRTGVVIAKGEKQ